jgi:RNA polymerase sigma-70 factor (sigma-E family)
MSGEKEREFVSFVEARSHSLFRTAMALTGHRQQAEDLLQTVLAKAFRRWNSIEGNPESYVRKALYRQQVSWWRRRASGREVTSAYVPEQPAAGDAIGQVDLSLALQEALRRLAPKYRAVLVLRYLEDLPDAEIAAILGCRPSTVRSQATRALSLLRRHHRRDGLAPADTAPYPHLKEAH